MDDDVGVGSFPTCSYIGHFGRGIRRRLDPNDHSRIRSSVRLFLESTRRAVHHSSSMYGVFYQQEQDVTQEQGQQGQQGQE